MGDLRLVVLRKARTVSVTIDGDVFEVREPTLKVRDEFMKKLSGGSGAEITGSMAEAQAYLAMACTYKPGTDERVFKPEELDALANAPSTSGVAALAEAAAGFFDTAARKEAGKSSAIPNAG